MVKQKFGKILVLALVVGLVLIAAACGTKTESTSGEAEKKTFKIGISQFVEHPALDAAREGFIEGLKEAGFKEGDNITINVENAQADFATAQTIAQKFVDEKVDIILAIATPTAQAAANVTKDIPILITAVTDPVASQLADSLEKPGTNVTGTTDMNPVADQLKLLKQIIPDAVSVGILYNSGEMNSVVQVEIAKKAAKDLGINIIEAAVSSSSEVNQAAASLVGKVDSIYIPTDNTIVSSIGAVLKVTNEAKIPVIGSERGQVDQGALATKGIDYFLLGKQTGKIAAKVLNGSDPAETPIEGSEDLKLVINKKAADELGIKIPEEVLSNADEIIK